MVSWDPRENTVVETSHSLQPRQPNCRRHLRDFSKDVCVALDHAQRNCFSPVWRAREWWVSRARLPVRTAQHCCVRNTPDLVESAAIWWTKLHNGKCVFRRGRSFKIRLPDLERKSLFWCIQVCIYCVLLSLSLFYTNFISLCYLLIGLDINIWAS